MKCITVTNYKGEKYLVNTDSIAYIAEGREGGADVCYITLKGNLGYITIIDASRTFIDEIMKECLS